MEWIVGVWYCLLFGWLFVVGSAIGSFLNVCIYRLPRGKNLAWPSSRCGSCYTPIPLYHNIPLISYWWLRGRCGTCGARFSMRYFWVEFGTGAMFAGLYALVIGLNIFGNPEWPRGGFSDLDRAQFPPHSWPIFAAHAALACLLLVAVGCLLERGELPGALVVTGGLLGLLVALLGPRDALWPALEGLLLIPWLMRFARYRPGDPFALAPGLLLMTGGFLGSPRLLVAIGFACVLSPLLWLGRVRAQPFALALCAGLVIAWLGWPWLSWLTGLGMPGLIVLAWALEGVAQLQRMPRGHRTQEAKPQGAATTNNTNQMNQHE